MSRISSNASSGGASRGDPSSGGQTGSGARPSAPQRPTGNTGASAQPRTIRPPSQAGQTRQQAGSASGDGDGWKGIPVVTRGAEANKPRQGAPTALDVVENVIGAAGGRGDDPQDGGEFESDQGPQDLELGDEGEDGQTQPGAEIDEDNAPPAQEGEGEDELDALTREVLGGGDEDQIAEAFGFLIPEQAAQEPEAAKPQASGLAKKLAKLEALKQNYPDMADFVDGIREALGEGEDAPEQQAKPQQQQDPRKAQQQAQMRRRAIVEAGRQVRSLVSEHPALSALLGPNGVPATPQQQQRAHAVLIAAGRLHEAFVERGRVLPDGELMSRAARAMFPGVFEQQAKKQGADQVRGQIKRNHREIDSVPGKGARTNAQKGDQGALNEINKILSGR